MNYFRLILNNWHWFSQVFINVDKFAVKGWLFLQNYSRIILVTKMYIKVSAPTRETSRSSNRRFRKIHRKIPVPGSFFNKVAGLMPATLLKKEMLAQLLSCCFFCEIFKNSSGWLLLYICLNVLTFLKINTYDTYCSEEQAKTI